MSGRTKVVPDCGSAGDVSCDQTGAGCPARYSGGSERFRSRAIGTSVSSQHPASHGPVSRAYSASGGSSSAPGIGLTFDTVSRPVGLDDQLRDGVVDLAIDWLPAELDPFVNRKLFDDRLILLARTDHPSVSANATIEDLRKAEFVAPHHRREIGHLPHALREFYKLGLHEAVRVSELLEIPTVVASTDLLGIFPASMGSLLEKRLGLRILAIPIELPALPIYMIWHETRRNDAAHRWLREIVAEEFGRLTP